MGSRENKNFYENYKLKCLCQKIIKIFQVILKHTKI